MTIREMRASLGNTRGEFAARYNIPFRTVQNWEAGVRNPPEYIMDLLESRVRADLVNRRTVELPKYNPQKRDLPKRRDYVGAMAWLKAVRDFLGEKIVFALDEALMCQGHFGGRSDEYLVWVYGDDAVTQYNGVVVLGNQVSHHSVRERNGLLYTDFMRWQTNPFWICRALPKRSASIITAAARVSMGWPLHQSIRQSLTGWLKKPLIITETEEVVCNDHYS